jgi:lipid-A-disaccharide synthase
MIVAGETSGDKHAAKLVQAIRNGAPEENFEFFGSAGEKMRAADVEATILADQLSIVGIAEIGAKLPMFIRAFGLLRKAAVARKPELAILVDFPEFNLKLAKTLKKLGIKVVYYISPQLWAWRRYRISTIRNYVDLLISILPFEKPWYREQGIHNVEYVGSPLSQAVHPDNTKEKFCLDHGIDPSKPIISLLPGSRQKEIIRILPVMIEAAELITGVRPNVQFVVAFASKQDKTFAETEIVIDDKLKIVVNQTYNALNASDVAAVTSGTATLETGIIGTPMAIVYKTSGINYRLIEPLISVDHYGLINLIAGERIAVELIQNDLTARSLSEELIRLMIPADNMDMRVKLRAAAEKLGQGGASKRAAEYVIRLLDA